MTCQQQGSFLGPREVREVDGLPAVFSGGGDQQTKINRIDWSEPHWDGAPQSG